MYLRIEIDVMARLNHPFLVNLNYSFQTPHAAFMVSLHGPPTLTRALTLHGPRP
jgi:hypothetical protein